MSLFKNKHMLVAGLIAPLMAVGAYYAVDLWVGEKPHAAEQGRSYPLVEMPNCRYDSGACGLKNNDFRLDIVANWLSDTRLSLQLTSAFPLEGVKLAMVTADTGETPPVEMQPASDDGLGWILEVDSRDPERDRLRLVAASTGSLYFGDASMKFTLRNR
jgi:hypothetical protein